MRFETVGGTEIRTIALYTTETMADWEYAYLTTQIAGAEQLKPGRFRLLLVGDGLEPVHTLGNLPLTLEAERGVTTTSGIHAVPFTAEVMRITGRARRDGRHLGTGLPERPGGRLHGTHGGDRRLAEQLRGGPLVDQATIQFHRAPRGVPEEPHMSKSAAKESRFGSPAERNRETLRIFDNETSPAKAFAADLDTTV